MSQRARPYPLSITDERDLPAGYSGDVHIWDIDKTYLATHFSSMGGLARIPVEFAIDKESIAGMADVLRGIRRGPGPTFAATPLYFVSSSPPQLRPVIARKMLLDGVQPDGFTFKNWLGTLRQLRPRRLKDHLGYKLVALLMGRRKRLAAREFLYGDDVERDAEAYSLYGSILSGEVSTQAIEGALITGRVAPEDRRAILDLVAELPRPVDGQVGQIFIHLARGTDPREFNNYGARLTPVRNACQLALRLLEMGLVDKETVLQTVKALRKQKGPVEETLNDAVARRMVRDETLAELGL